MAEKTETRRFGMHAKLLYDVILRQAGSVEKAVLEGVMNSVDAGATVCAITLEQDVIEISDNGKGIQTREQIEKYFETFGQPHEESEGKKFGTFRMGRGQLFAFGVNVWRTGEFRMEVDIKHKGLDYVLESGQKPFPGCGVRVELYTKLVSSAVYEAILILKRWCRYAPLKVTLNGEVISIDPTTEEWDHVLPEAYVRLNRSGELSVYNLGVYVCGMPNYRLGTGGEVVSRLQLKMNFARNDIQSDCPVWAKLKPFSDKYAEKRMKKRTTPLSDWERQRLAQKLRQDWKEHRDLLDQKVCTSSNGRGFSIHDLAWHGKHFRRFAGRIARAPYASTIGDRVQQEGLALVVCDDTLKNFGFAQTEVGLSEFLVWVNTGPLRDSGKRWVVTPLKVLENDIGKEATFLDEKKYSPRIRVWVRFLEDSMRELCDVPRAVKVGKFKGADAWTDGMTYVCFDDVFLRNAQYDLLGIVNVLLALVHEVSHDDETKGSHIHSTEFYEGLEDHLRAKLARCVDAGPRRLISAMESVGRKLNKEARRLKDPVDKVEIAAAQLKETCTRTGQPFVG